MIFFLHLGPEVLASIDDTEEETKWSSRYQEIADLFNVLYEPFFTPLEPRPIRRVAREAARELGLVLTTDGKEILWKDEVITGGTP